MKNEILVVTKGELELIHEALLNQREEFSKKAFELIDTGNKDLVKLKSKIAQTSFLIRNIENEIKN